MKHADKALIKLNHLNMLQMAAKGSNTERKVARAVLIMDSPSLGDGGPGSGNFGHKGRPGLRGGSGGGGSGTGNLVPRKPASPAPSRKISSKRFVSVLEKAKSSCPEETRWRVDSTRSAADFDAAGIRTFKTPGGSTFALKTDGDIISVCKHQANDRTTNARDLIAAAVAQGGTHLDSYDGNYYFYAKCGFEVVSRCKFDPEYAPPGWNPDRDAEEDIVFMRYVGVGNVRDQSKTAMRKRVPYSADYGEAEAACKRMVAEGKNDT